MLVVATGLAWACTATASVRMIPDVVAGNREAVASGRVLQPGPVEIRWNAASGPSIATTTADSKFEILNACHRSANRAGCLLPGGGIQWAAGGEHGRLSPRPGRQRRSSADIGEDVGASKSPGDRLESGSYPVHRSLETVAPALPAWPWTKTAVLATRRPLDTATR